MPGVSQDPGGAMHYVGKIRVPHPRRLMLATGWVRDGRVHHAVGGADSEAAVQSFPDRLREGWGT